MDVLPIGLYMKPTTSNPKLKKSNYRGMVICDNWVDFSMLKQSIFERKGEACDIPMEDLNQSRIWHQGISLLLQDGT
jgi:hypothetical protein